MKLLLILFLTLLLLAACYNPYDQCAQLTDQGTQQMCFARADAWYRWHAGNIQRSLQPTTVVCQTVGNMTQCF